MLQLQHLHQWLCNDIHKPDMDVKKFRFPNSCSSEGMCDACQKESIEASIANEGL